MDNLTYTLNGNQLSSVTDAVSTAAYGSNTAFSGTSSSYAYDKNGNLTKDSGKGISNITYNVLNLPQVITFSDGSTITYTYAADGTKLRTVHVISATTIQTDYCGNVIYESGAQKYLLNEVGYYNLASSVYCYYLKDHQGNNRVVINSSGTVLETNHYYPFGGLFASTSVQPFKYNGKEFDSKKGLNWYDYGARHYDATLGRWHVVDPLADKYYGYSPYNYCANSPIQFVDPNGEDIKIWYNNEQGERTYFRFNGSNAEKVPNNQFVHDVIAVYNYNKTNGEKKKNGGGASTVAIVEDKGILVNVSQSSKKNQYNRQYNTIYWNPTVGLKTEQGIVLSAATSFDHEADHAKSYLEDWKAFNKRFDEKDQQYDNKEERRVITDSEQKTALANGDIKPGQITRRNYDGTFVHTKSVISKRIK